MCHTSYKHVSRPAPWLQQTNQEPYWRHNPAHVIQLHFTGIGQENEVHTTHSDLYVYLGVMWYTVWDVASVFVREEYVNMSTFEVHNML